ncbi:MAG: TonB-dependent receptor [Planctomycetales bacterium]
MLLNLSVTRMRGVVSLTGFCMLFGQSVFAQRDADRPYYTTVRKSYYAAEKRQEAAQQDPASEDEAADSADDELDDLINIGLENLGNVEVAPALGVEVSSVSRTESTVGKSPAAIFVITNEMIRRSGAREIPEVLRMAPGVNVQRTTSNKWAVSIRGFNNRFSNKLLVQIDGRDVYTPLFGGVYWDAQDVLLEDVDRIEIIRGPGATVWGANAVNGIISIITKNSKDTQGLFAETGVGDKWQGFASARYGGQIGRDATYRVWGKWFEREESPTAQNFPGAFPITSGVAGPASDSWRMGHGGARIDWEPTCCDRFMLQGAYYDQFAGGFSAFPDLAIPFAKVVGDSGENLAGSHVLARWTHKIDDEREWSVQTFYDRNSRAAVVPGFVLGAERDTIDADFQYRFPIGPWHQVICGARYRYTDDLIANSATILFNPTTRPLDRFSYFAQDRMTLIEDEWFFILGSKFSHNDFTGFEMQPSGRILWTPNERTSIWGAVSRAVRTPTRADTDLTIRLIPPFGINLVGNPAQASEEVLAYEIGARAQPVDEFFWDVALFYNDYSDRSTTTTVPGGAVFQNVNDHVFTWGGELASTYELNSCSRVRGAYSFFRGQGYPGNGPTSYLGGNVLNTPRNQLYVQYSRDIGCDVSFDWIGRYVDHIGGAPPSLLSAGGTTNVPKYVEMDARVAWRPLEDVELFVVGRNLLDQQHLESPADSAGVFNAEVPREFYIGAAIRQ